MKIQYVRVCSMCFLSGRCEEESLRLVWGGAGSPSVNVRLLRCNVSSHAWVTLYAMNAKNFWCALIKNKQKNQQRNQKIVKWINYHIKIKKSNASKFIHFVIFFFFPNRLLQEKRAENKTGVHLML